MTVILKAVVVGFGLMVGAGAGLLFTYLVIACAMTAEELIRQRWGL